MNKQKRAPWQDSLHASFALCLSYIPVGLACGSITAQVGFDPLLGGSIIYLSISGGAQFLVASMLATQAPFSTTLLMVFF